MYRYAAFALNIHSEVELPGFPASCGEPDVTIRLGSVNRARTAAAIDDEVASPVNVGWFHIVRGREIIVDLLPCADPGELRTLLAGRLMGFLLRQRGYLALHASAVAIDGQGVLFVGDSGSGKSTTAAAFHSRGHDLLADDVAAVRIVKEGVKEGVEVQAACTGLRLREDSRVVMGAAATPAGFQAEKRHYILQDQPSAGACSVKRIYVLEFGDCGGPSQIHATAMPGFRSAALLSAHSFLRKRKASHALRQINLDRAGAVAAAAPVLRLVRARSLNLLPALVNFVEKELSASD
jgi:hypothetical protein